MELDSKNLGRLRHVANPRDVWISESGDFTPWLADNIDVLADELGMTLTITGTEVPVGGFRLDIRAEDADGQVVVIENQLERTDHSHLGQCLVYASGLDAAAVVWVSPEFREEFRQALDWLNERTDLGINFFGVEVGLVQIGESPIAPVFEVVARPNDWQKAVKSAAKASPDGGASVSPLNARRQDLFADILDDVVAAEPSIRKPARDRGNWIAFGSGPFGNWTLTVDRNGDLRVEAYIDTGDKLLNERLFDEFHLAKVAVEDAVAQPLSWERLDDRRASRIGGCRALAINDDGDVAEARSWAATTFLSLYAELNSPLRARAKELREEQRSADDDAAASAHEAEEQAVLGLPPVDEPSPGGQTPGVGTLGASALDSTNLRL